MSTTPAAVALQGRFAADVPAMALPWRASPVAEPQPLVVNDALARELGWSPEWLRSPEGLQLLTGNVPDDVATVAQAYAGHQFGNFNPRLGDGRALLVGEVVDAAGRLRDLHLKGSGRTPFSRGGDGFAAVGPMLREYVVSEAMNALGIPTTRSLAVLATGRPVRRETLLPGAVLARVASSHLRVGSFQYARITDDPELLRRLADHAIERHYPEAAGAPQPYLALLDGVIAAQAELIAQWMLVGFVHGVMNTDNTTISGETIDYGPCAFLDSYEPSTVFSSIDAGGRYAYGNQPAIGQWNLTRLAEAMLPLLGDEEEPAVALAVQSLERYPDLYEAARRSGLRAKLGLGPAVDDELVAELGEELLALLRSAGLDLTSSFRQLASAARGDASASEGLFTDPAVRLAGQAWLVRWLALTPNAAAMDRVNPVYIPRNHLVEEALAAVVAGDPQPFEWLVDVVTHPYDERPGFERYAAPASADFGPYTTYCGT